MNVPRSYALRITTSKLIYITVLSKKFILLQVSVTQFVHFHILYQKFILLRVPITQHCKSIKSAHYFPVLCISTKYESPPMAGFSFTLHPSGNFNLVEKHFLKLPFPSPPLPSPVGVSIDLPWRSMDILWYCAFYALHQEYISDPKYCY